MDFDFRIDLVDQVKKMAVSRIKPEPPRLTAAVYSKRWLEAATDEERAAILTESEADFAARKAKRLAEINEWRAMLCKS